MNTRRSQFLQQYREALLAHLKEGKKAKLGSANGLGGMALAAGLRLMDLATLHEKTLVREVLPGCTTRERAALLKEAGAFFAAAIAPVVKAAKRGTSKGAASLDLEVVMATLSQRTVQLAAANLELSREMAQRKAADRALLKKERSHRESLEKSVRLQAQLRELSRQLLSAQEDERRKISRELHDVIGQTLAGITIHLASLKKEAALNPKSLGRTIARTQRLVEKSADSVNRFARELRPSVLDDLGLIPALHSYMKSFTARSGVRTRLIAVSAVEKLDTNRRTTLFRVAQEALANVARHAEATRVVVTIERLPVGIGMSIKDDGKSFRVEDTLQGKPKRKRLGLLGMRERVEMVGGRFQVESVRGAGTTINVSIPFRKKREKKL